MATILLVPVRSWASQAGGHLTLPAALVRMVRSALARRRQRIALAGLDERLLRDIGLTGADVRVEVAKSVWM